MKPKITCELCKHMAYPRIIFDRYVWRCDDCGAQREFENDIAPWKKICDECSTELKPNENLEGLFVPHFCHSCMEKERKKHMAEGSICGICGKPYCDCYCYW